MDNNQWKESDIYKLNIERKKLSEYLCVLLEELAANLFINQNKVCKDEGIAKKIIIVSKDGENNIHTQVIKKYINIENGINVGVSFSCDEYQMYYLSSWVTRNLCNIANKVNEYSFDEFFEINFGNIKLLHKNFWFLQKFTNQIKEYSIDVRDFKSAIFEYTNSCLANNLFYNSDELTIDLSKKILFFNMWGIIKSYYYCQNPINSENKYIFAKLIRDFYNSAPSKAETCIQGMNLAFMDFSEIDLSEIVFCDTDFTQTNFYNANLDNVTFDGLRLVNANFEAAFMEVAGIFDCNCSGAVFKGTHLLASVINNSNFCGADFRGTNLMECDIKNTCFINTKFNENTALNFTTFVNSSLSEIDLAGVSISQEQSKYFWENITGLNDIKVYGRDYKTLKETENQATLYNELIASTSDYLIQNEFPKTSTDIFISHSTLEKREIAKPVSKFLETYGYSCWIDDVLKEKDKLRFSIETAILNCQSAIVIMSENFTTRAWTKYEWFRLTQESKKRKVKVIVIAYHLAEVKELPVEFKKIIIQKEIEDEFWETLIKLLEME